MVSYRNSECFALVYDIECCYSLSFRNCFIHSRVYIHALKFKGITLDHPNYTTNEIIAKYETKAWYKLILVLVREQYYNEIMLPN